MCKARRLSPVVAAETFRDLDEETRNKLRTLPSNDQVMADAIKNRHDIVLDQTNLTKKSRARKMAQLPRAYKKYAVFFPVPEEVEWKRRLSARPGKCIPQSVLDDMQRGLELPSVAEGFDEVMVIAQ